MLPYKKYFANYSVRKHNYLNGTKHEKYPFKAIINIRKFGIGMKLQFIKIQIIQIFVSVWDFWFQNFMWNMSNYIRFCSIDFIIIIFFLVVVVGKGDFFLLNAPRCRNITWGYLYLTKCYLLYRLFKIIP